MFLNDHTVREPPAATGTGPIVVDQTLLSDIAAATIAFRAAWPGATRWEPCLPPKECVAALLLGDLLGRPLLVRNGCVSTVSTRDMTPEMASYFALGMKIFGATQNWPPAWPRDASEHIYRNSRNWRRTPESGALSQKALRQRDIDARRKASDAAEAAAEAAVIAAVPSKAWRLRPL